MLNSWYFIGYLLTKSKDHLSKSAEFNFRDGQPIVVVAVVILKLDRLCCSVVEIADFVFCTFFVCAISYVYSYKNKREACASKPSF